MKNTRPKGYWKEINNIIKELKSIVDDLGYIPSTDYLSKNGYSTLARGIEKYHSMCEIKKIFGEEDSIRKNLKDYSDFEVLKDEYYNFYKELGRIPRCTDFSIFNKSYILNAIIKYFLSYSNFKFLVGVNVRQRPDGYWKNHDNLILEAQKIIKEFGYLPPSSFLNDNGYSTFVNSVYLHYSSFNQFRRSLNQELLQQKEPGYWNKEIIFWRALEIISDYGYFLSGKELKDKNMGDLLSAIQKYFNGVENFVKLFNFPISPNLKINSTVSEYEAELENLCYQLGYFPSYQDLISRGVYGLLSFIRQKYGSLLDANFVVSKELNLRKRVLVSKDGHFCDSFAEKVVDDKLYEKNIKHYRNVVLDISQVKCVPDFILADNIILEVLMFDPDTVPTTAMQKHYLRRYEKKRTAYINNNFTVVEILSKHVNNEEYLDNKIDEIIAILIHKKDFNVSNSFKLETRKKPIGFWMDFENLKTELLPICQLHKRMPTYKELELLGRSDIIHAVNRYYKNFRTVGEIIGFPVYENVSHKPRGFWITNPEYIVEEIKKLEIRNGKFPTASLVNSYSKSLYYAINKYYAGLSNFRKNYCSF